jgi:hypothetical protein
MHTTVYQANHTPIQILPQHQEHLMQRGIDLGYAAQLGLCSIDARTASDLLGYSAQNGGLAIPYPNELGYYRVRLDPAPDGTYPQGKFGSPKGKPVPIYKPFQGNPLHVAIVEGPLKAASLTSAGIPAIGLGGVNTCLDGDTLNASWNALLCPGLVVFILFDAGCQ